MKHLNNNLLCAIDVETTGLIPGHNEIWELAIVPLDFSLKPSADPRLKYLYMVIQPENIDAIDMEAIKVSMKTNNGVDFEDAKITNTELTRAMKDGISKYRAVDLIIQWFEDLKLLPRKRIVPLAHNWPFDRDFLTALLSKDTMEYIFDPRYRDTMSTAGYFNDLSEMNCSKIKHVNLKLGTLCTNFNVERHHNHNALDDAVATAEVYRSMIHFPHVPIPAENYK